MILANALQKGDTIGVVAPSKPFNKDKKFELDGFIAYMESQGMKVVLSDNFYAQATEPTGYVAPEERADDINTMFSDKNIKAIWCFQGGGLGNQTLDLIDFENARANPKLFMGKSDIDIFLLALYKKIDLVTIHCCDTKIGSNKEMDFEYTKKWFTKRLFEKSKIIEPSEEWTCMNEGQAEGTILGCNLTSIENLIGTDYLPDFSDSIVCLETLRSNTITMTKQLTHLKQAGIFQNVKGVIVGNNCEFSGEGIKAEELIRDSLKEYNFPMLKINEFGHYQPHAFLPIGVRAKLDATNKSIEIIEDFLC